MQKRLPRSGKSFIEQLNALALKNRLRLARRFREGAKICDEDDDEDMDEDDADAGTSVMDDDDWRNSLMAAMKIAPPDIAKKIHALLKPQDTDDDGDDDDADFVDKMEALHRKNERRRYGVQLIREARRRTGQPLRIPGGRRSGKSSGRRGFTESRETRSLMEGWTEERPPVGVRSRFRNFGNATYYQPY